jgi:hypothetical protein
VNLSILHPLSGGEYGMLALHPKLQALNLKDLANNQVAIAQGKQLLEII